MRDITKLSGYPPSNVKTRLEQSNYYLASGRFPLQNAIYDNTTCSIREWRIGRKAIKLFCQVSEEPAFEVAFLEFTNMRDYLMTVIALANAHRFGVSANMTLTEFKREKIYPKSGNVLLHVMNHKTL